jgi:hypothetical protein
MRTILTGFGTALALILAWPGAAGAATATGPASARWVRQHVPLPAGGKSGGANAVSCPSASDCVLAGDYSTSDSPTGQGLPLAEAWNGHAWSPESVPTPAGGQFVELEGLSCASATRCVAVGEYEKTGLNGSMIAEVRNGSTWSAQTSFPLPSGGTEGQFLQGVWCVTASNCTAVGTYYTASDGRHPVAEHWNGHAWSPEAVPDPGKSQNSYLTGIACLSAGSCLATGYYFTTGTNGVGKPFAARWNGHTWALLSTPLPAAATNGGALESLSCPSASDCTAVGSYFNKKTEGSYDLAEHWNGSTWAIQPAPSPATKSQVEDGLDGVSCLSASRCTAVGFADDYAPLTHVRPLAEYWNGSTWTVQQTAQPQADQGLGSVVCLSAGGCTAVGEQTQKGGTGVLPLAERN